MVIYKTKEEVHNRACEAVNETMSQLLAGNPEKKSGKKSRVGDAWESWFGVEKNNVAGPDLPEAGVELKATGVKETKNGKSSKERLVLNIINYIDEFDKTFYTSSFWKKNQFMELGFYGYDKEIDWLDWKILQVALFSFPEKDLLIIKDDWATIHQYIKDGRAHELTEGVTNYLGACTKGANKNSKREQHPSLNGPKAMQRAYSLKSKYMTFILREYVFGDNEDDNIRIKPYGEAEVFSGRQTYNVVESLIKDISILENTSLEKYILDKLSPYVGKTVDELILIFDLSINKENGEYPKSVNSMLVRNMLGLSHNIKEEKGFDAIEEFFKANISVKTIRLQKNNKIKESMSFPAFSFIDLSQENWEESELNDMFESTKFFFVVFHEQADGRYIFRGAKFWSMPIEDLEGTVKYAWQDTVDKINDGVELVYNGRRVENNFISAKDDKIIHVRPHASKSSYVEDKTNASQLPVPAKWTNKPVTYSDNYMTKQSFWLNNSYVLEQIKDIL